MPSQRLRIALTIALCLNISVAIAKQDVAIPQNISFDAIPVCYDFGCKQHSIVKFSTEEKQAIKNRFSTVANNAEEERQQIRQAIGWMEVLIGRHTPTHKDVAFNFPTKNEPKDNLFPGQQDCIDEAFNTTVYLKLLEQEGLLKYHKVIARAYRQSLFDQHWAGHIEELNSGKKYVVDSWFQPNGYLPVVQPSEQWHDISLLTSLVDSSSREDATTKTKTSFWRKIIGSE